MTGRETGDGYMSAECTVAQRPEYEELHATCRQTNDVPLPHSSGLLLVRRCPCACHTTDGGHAGEA